MNRWSCDGKCENTKAVQVQDIENHITFTCTVCGKPAYLHFSAGEVLHVNHRVENGKVTTTLAYEEK